MFQNPVSRCSRDKLSALRTSVRCNRLPRMYFRVCVRREMPATSRVAVSSRREFAASPGLPEIGRQSGLTSSGNRDEDRAVTQHGRFECYSRPRNCSVVFRIVRSDACYSSASAVRFCETVDCGEKNTVVLRQDPSRIFARWFKG